MMSQLRTTGCSPLRKPRSHLLVCESLEARSLLSGITLQPISTVQTGEFLEGAAEIVAYHSGSRQMYVTNSSAATVDIFDIRRPANPRLISTIDVSDIGSPNSVAVNHQLVAVAIEAHNPQDPGYVRLYTPRGRLLNTLQVGSLPDMLTFTPNGRTLLVANEGEPSGYEDGSVDPEGSVSIIPIPVGLGRVSRLTDNDVRTATFESYNDQADELRDQGIRIFGPGATVAQDLEPEYITVVAHSGLAYVSLQENNALAVLDIRQARFVDLLPLGYKNHQNPDTGALDASDRDDEINIRNWPVYGMYQPDAIASYQVHGQTFIVTSNEGDARDYDGFGEEERVNDLDLDPTAFPNADELQENQNLGRLTVTTTRGDDGPNGSYTSLYAFGARSFSIRRADGTLVYDSGSQFEEITGEVYPDFFNSTNDANNFDNRSDNKGPEPEGLVLGIVHGRVFAFIGLERIGGVMIYDITNPNSPYFVDYINNRNFEGDPEDGTAGDLGPEGLVFIPASHSPSRKPLLIVANEVSGTVTTYAIVGSTSTQPIPIDRGIRAGAVARELPSPAASVSRLRQLRAGNGVTLVVNEPGADGLQNPLSILASRKLRLAKGGLSSS